MARCGCVEKCSCVFEEGICAEVEIQVTSDGGCISPTFSYGVNVITDNQTVFCGPNGLNAGLTHIDTNTIDLEGLGTAGSPLEAHVIRTADGSVPDTSGSGLGNLIKELPGIGAGIYVSCEDVQDCVGAAIDAITTDCLEYDDATNTISIAICGEPNGIECAAAGDPACPAGGLLVTPSSDANNTLTFGTDGRLFAAAAAIAPGDCMIFTGSGTPGDPFVMTPQIAPELNGVECIPGVGLAVIPSSDALNGLTFGADQRLWANRCPLVVGGSQVLTGNAGPCFELVGGDDCVTPMLATLRLSDDPCQGLQCRADGLFVEHDPTNLPASVNTTQAVNNLGPFAGTTPDFVVVQGPTCITITNPSTCKDMLVGSRLNGFAEIGRNTGEMRIQFAISESGNPAGPYFTVSQVGQANPTPPSRQTGNALWTGTFFTVAPGASRSVCARISFRTAAATNGRIFNAQYTLEMIGRWAN